MEAGDVNKEELIEVLRQFDEKRVEELPEKTRNIFYAIMKIADERDKYIHLYESTLKDLGIAVKNKIELENIRKEAIKFILQNCEIIRHEKENIDEVGRVNGAELLNILNKGDSNVKDKR
jgi:hypothetical protein